jgi:hypothetical protein
LTNLTEMYLKKNNISNISSISGLTNLTCLDLAYNDISDISVISGLTNLTQLWIKKNPLNTAAYCEYMPLIESNNPGLFILQYDPNPNPFTDDCSTNLSEYAIFTAHWLETGCGVGNNWCSGADLNHRDDVNLDDFAEFAGYWLK